MPSVIANGLRERTVLRRLRRWLAGKSSLLATEGESVVDPRKAAEVLKSRGNGYFAQGDLDQAVGCYQAAIRLWPDYAEALNNLGSVYMARGKYVEAEAFFLQARSLDPRLAGAHYNLGMLAHEQKRFGQAVLHYRQAIELAPDNTGILGHLGHCLHLGGRDDEAMEVLTQVLTIDPGHIDAYDNIGAVLGLQGRYREALRYYQRSLDIAERPQTHYSLGVVHQALRQWDTAQAHFQAAIDFDPGYFQARWNLALLLLLRGDLAGGFAQYESCLVDAGSDSPRSKDAPHFLAKLGADRYWRGNALTGQRILVWTEQGLGDTLMMLRYLSLLHDRGASSIQIYCEAPLVRLVEHLPYAVTAFSKPDHEITALAYDHHCSTMSLPYLFGTTRDCIPAVVPYLRVPDDMRRRWEARLASLPGRRIGLVWGGSKTLAGDARRSIPLVKFAPLMTIQGVSWVSLQKGEPAAQLHDTGWPISDWMDECADLLDTAALLTNLDLVVCVDTAVAHLAGALGKPVWLLNRYESEWRWLLEGEGSPWYPTIRIFRQPGPHDWDSVIGHIAGELRLSFNSSSPSPVKADTTTSDAEALKAQGNAYFAQGDLPGAIDAYRRALNINPRYAEAHNNLGLIQAMHGWLDEAIASYRQAITLKPGLGQAYSNLGSAYKAQGALDEALASYRQAVAVTPCLALAHNNLGAHLLELGDFTEARQCFETAIALEPGFAEAHNNLGNTFRANYGLDEALACFERAVALKPDLAKAHNNRGIVYQDQGRLTEAYACYREALAIDPDYADAFSNLVFAKQYDYKISAPELLAEHRAFATHFEAPLKAAWLSHTNSRDPGRRLRIGFVSGDFRAHPVGFFIENILAHLDHATLDITLYPTSPRVDGLTERLRESCNTWHPLVGMSDADAARCIRNDAIDILVDLSGHTADNRLLVFARKPAPVQVSWLYFSTTGLSAMDYLLCDRYVVPPEETGHFVELPWHLPDSYLCFTPPLESITVGPPPALKNGCITFGCFNSLSKLNTRVVSLWAQLLLAIPEARLFLKATQLNDATTRSAVLARFADRGIPSERILLEGPSSRIDYLASYNRVDIALDPFPFPGGTTTVEALWMAVPVLTRRGNRFISHAGESILHTVGLADWIARDDADYVAKAFAFANDLDSLADLRAGQRARFSASPLCDAPRFARNLDAAFRGMWQAYCTRPRAAT